MSVERCEYTIIGINIIDKIKDISWDEMEVIEDKIHEVGLNFIYDGMSGKYCYVGKTLRESEGYGETNTYEINHEDIKEICCKVGIKLYTVFEDKEIELPKLISFTHWY